MAQSRPIPPRYHPFPSSSHPVSSYQYLPKLSFPDVASKPALSRRRFVHLRSLPGFRSDYMGIPWSVVMCDCRRTAAVQGGGKRTLSLCFRLRSLLFPHHAQQRQESCFHSFHGRRHLAAFLLLSVAR